MFDGKRAYQIDENGIAHEIDLNADDNNRSTDEIRWLELSALDETGDGKAQGSMEDRDGGLQGLQLPSLDTNDGGNEVFIRADHPEFTAQQLLRHEMAHREFGHEGENLSGKVDVRKVYDRLVELCGSEEVVKDVIAMYSTAFDMGYDAETGIDALAMEVFTEIVCDSQANMNAFAPEDRAVMAGFMREIKRLAQEEKAQNSGRAPPDMDVKTSAEKKQEVIRNGQKGKAEDRQSFLARVHGSPQTSGEIGQIAYAYKEANSYNITAYAEGTQRELQELGIKSFVYQKMEYNDDGYTYRVKDNSISLIDGNECIVGIQARFVGDAREVAGHEAFHIWSATAGREEFNSILRDQLIDYSDRYFLIALSVASAYQVSKHSKSDASALYAEEILARIAGQIHSGAYENGLRTMFRDYDTVKSAWNALVKSNAKTKFSRESVVEQAGSPAAMNALLDEQPPADGNVSFSRNGYWVPKLTQQEKSRVEYIINNNRGTQLTSNCNVFFDKSKGNILFGIYSTDDSTLLYASNGKTAEKEHLFADALRKEFTNGNVANTSTEGLRAWAKTVRVQRASSISYGAGNVAPGGLDGDVGLYDRTSGLYASRALRSVLANLFSAETERRSGERSVKTSREALDSQGRVLSREQQEYFKDSKVRDEQGRLLVMYRGDQEDFTVFDRKKSSYSNLYGRGFYFTNSASHAGQYGTAKPFYLNITKPVSTTERTITKPQMRKFLEAVADNADDFSFENYGYGATVDSVLESVYSGKNDFAMLYDVSQTAIGDMVAAVELFNEVNGTGYDGFILDTETVIFHSNQAKNVDNTKPSADPDVRFSREFIRAQMTEQEKQLQKVNEALEKDNAKLQEDNQYLKQLLKLQREVTGGTKFTKSSVEAMARQLKTKANASGDTKELAALLNSFYGKITFIYFSTLKKFILKFSAPYFIMRWERSI